VNNRPIKVRKKNKCIEIGLLIYEELVQGRRSDQFVDENVTFLVVYWRHSWPKVGNRQTEQTIAYLLKSFAVPRVYPEASNSESFRLNSATGGKVVCRPVVLMRSATRCQDLNIVTSLREPGRNLPSMLFSAAL
jgi:hypothetical protein